MRCDTVPGDQRDARLACRELRVATDVYHNSDATLLHVASVATRALRANILLFLNHFQVAMQRRPS